MSDSVRVRFAPSPTGYLHIGGVRTAIFNYLFARHHGGQYFLRIEDTDRERSTPEAVAQIVDSLGWLDLLPDAEPIFQSQRTAIYQAHIDRLLQSGQAYRCTCSQEELERKRQAAIEAKTTYRYDGACRRRGAVSEGQPFVVRFRTPEVYPSAFEDLVLGAIPIDEERLDDWIIARQDGSPTYNFCVVVDDASMGITHVIRGNDHVANTPKQILLYQALGYPVPQFAHMPLTHGPDGSKLSKRKEEEYRKLGISVSVQEYRNMGFLPQALVNYLCRLGWAHGDQEIFSRDELARLFDLVGVGKSKSVIDPEKLRWVNAQYLKATPDSELAGLLQPFLAQRGFDAAPGPRLERIAATLKERARTLDEMAEAARIYFEAPAAFDPKAVAKHWKGEAALVVRRVLAFVAESGVLDTAAMEARFRALADEVAGGKLGQVAQPVRIALTGSSASPSLFDVMAVLGATEVASRLERALAQLG